MACLFHNPKNIVMYGFIIQGTSSIITFFLFKASDDMLKLFALCRFFELYFIVPHYMTTLTLASRSRSGKIKNKIENPIVNKTERNKKI